jgi:hypothetical protein
VENSKQSRKNEKNKEIEISEADLLFLEPCFISGEQTANLGKQGGASREIAAKMLENGNNIWQFFVHLLEQVFILDVRAILAVFVFLRLEHTIIGADMSIQRFDHSRNKTTKLVSDIRVATEERARNGIGNEINEHKRKRIRRKNRVQAVEQEASMVPILDLDQP